MDLSQYLETQNVTQADFAKRLGVSQGMVWQWLRGRRQIAAEQVLPIEKATGGLIKRHELRPDIYPPREQRAKTD